MAAQSTSAEDTPSLALTPSLAYHRLVWHNDTAGLQSLVQQQQQLQKSPSPKSTNTNSELIDVNTQDVYGNTPLLLAVQLGRTECVKLLLAHGAKTKYRNSAGWSPIHEAICYGDRDLLREIFLVWSDRSANEFDSKIDGIMEKIRNIGDFYLSVEWKFSSWVPLLGRVLPSDQWKIYKKGTSVRIDTSLVDFSKSSLSWKRGSMSFLFDFTVDKKQSLTSRVLGRANDRASKGKVSIYVADHINKVYAKISKDDELPSYSHSHAGTGTGASAVIDEEVEDKLDALMSTPLINVTSPGVIEFQRSRSGFIGFRHDKNETVGNYNCRVYDVKNIYLLTQKRLEHLSDDEKKEFEKASKLMNSTALNKELEEELKIDENDLDMIDEPKVHRQSLPRPPPPTISESQYFNNNKPLTPVMIYTSAQSMRDELQADGLSRLTSQQRDSILSFQSPPVLGRPIDCIQDLKTYTASVWQSDEFPLRVETIVAILDLVAPHQRHVEKIRTFIESRLPPGFPVKIQLPIFPTITATVTFSDYSDASIDASLLRVPSEYREDPSKFKLFFKEHHAAQ